MTMDRRACPEHNGQRRTSHRGYSLRKIGSTLLAFIGLLPASAWAQDGAMTLVLRCKNDGGRVELYVPQSIVTGRTLANINLSRPTNGFYALDLTEYQKGKSLEPARVRLTPDKKGVVVEQTSRRLPATTVPVAGGKVSFDKRFAEDMVCEAFNGTE
jgi:hypothetical protein